MMSTIFNFMLELLSIKLKGLTLGYSTPYLHPMSRGLVFLDHNAKPARQMLKKELSKNEALWVQDR